MFSKTSGRICTVKSKNASIIQEEERLIEPRLNEVDKELGGDAKSRPRGLSKTNRLKMVKVRQGRFQEVIFKHYKVVF